MACAGVEYGNEILFSVYACRVLPWRHLSGGQNSISKTLLLAKWTFFYIKNTVNRVKH